MDRHSSGVVKDHNAGALRHRIPAALAVFTGSAGAFIAAVGKGVDWIDNCKPDCAEGTFHPYRGRAVAYKAQHKRFRRLTIHFHYHHRWHVDRRTLTHSGSYFAWAIADR